MIRFISFLFNKPYEPCKSCETLKEQLSFERAEKIRLTDTLLGIIQPKAFEAPAVELEPINKTSGSWTKRRAILEAKDKETEMLKARGEFLGKPDNLKIVESSNKRLTDEAITKLEKELEIDKDLEEAQQKEG